MSIDALVLGIEKELGLESGVQTRSKSDDTFGSFHETYVPIERGTFSMSMLTPSSLELLATRTDQVTGRKNVVNQSTFTTPVGAVPHTRRVMDLDVGRAECFALQELRDSGYNVPVVYQYQEKGNQAILTMEQIPGHSFHELLGYLNPSNERHQRLKLMLFEGVMQDIVSMKRTLESLPEDKRTNYESKLPATFSRLLSEYDIHRPDSSILTTRVSQLGKQWDDSADSVFLDRIPSNIVFNYLGVLEDLQQYASLPRKFQQYANGRIMRNHDQVGEYLLDLMETEEHLVTELLFKHMYHIDFDTVTRKTAKEDDIVIATDYEVAQLSAGEREALHLRVSTSSNRNVIGFSRNLRQWEFHTDKPFSPDPKYNLQLCTEYAGIPYVGTERETAKRVVEAVATNNLMLQ